MLQNLFNKYDENMNGGIDFGSEFDAFLYEYNSLIGCGKARVTSSRDQLREEFSMVDSSKDGIISYNEIYPSALQKAKSMSLIIETRGRSQSPKLVKQETSHSPVRPNDKERSIRKPLAADVVERYSPERPKYGYDANEEEYSPEIDNYSPPTASGWPA